MQSEKTKWYGTGQFDSVNSSFKSITYCVGGKSFPGYSKGKYSTELKDKIVLLEKWIIRIANKGYFNPEKIEKIEFYQKSFLNNNDQLIFTLYPTKYAVANYSKYSTNERLIAFLNSFYKALRAGKIELKYLLDRPQVLSEGKWLDKPFLKNESHLLEFILIKKREGYPDGFLMNFAQKYREKYGHLFK